MTFVDMKEIIKNVVKDIVVLETHHLLEDKENVLNYY